MRKTEAIKRACLIEFPPKQYEGNSIIEREIREGVDEMCRRCLRRQKLSNIN